LRGKPFYKTDQYGDVFNVNFWTPFWGNVLNKMSKTFCAKDCVVIAHMPSGILFADKLGLPFCAGVHNSDLEILTNPLYKFHFKKRLKQALDNAKAIACRSFIIEKKLLQIYPEYSGKTFVAPSGFDIEKILDIEIFNNSIISNNSNLKIVTCANFKKRKNIDKLIKACKGNFELTVIGDGKSRKKLEKLDKNVKFTGWLKPDEVLEQMRQADVFILPSVGETFGMVYLEAMAQGCITICTQNDGIDGIIKDGENGFLTVPTVDGIKDTLKRVSTLTTDGRKALIQKSLNTVRELSSQKCADNYLQQLLKIL
jgi:glycosyltransferase involved in cell wall biosynthesis